MTWRRDDELGVGLLGIGGGIDSLKGESSFFERDVGRQRAGTSRVIKFHIFLG